MAEYPTEEELDRVKNWLVLATGVLSLIDFVKSIWWSPDWGFKVKNGRNTFREQVLRWELHTGGWSGNEDIMSALQSNFIFWTLCWVQSRRGGHYLFEVERNFQKRG